LNTIGVAMRISQSLPRRLSWSSLWYFSNKIFIHSNFSVHFGVKTGKIVTVIST